MRYDHLRLKSLSIVFQPEIYKNKIPLLKNGVFQLVCPRKNLIAPEKPEIRYCRFTRDMIYL